MGEDSTVISFFKKYKIWHINSKNPTVTSCKDASSKRKRLGEQGIPLYDELKSSAAKTLIGGEKVFLFCHCRANAYLDFNKIKQALNIKSEIYRLSKEELFNNFKAQYGTVNPFQDRTDLIQVFDEDIFNFYTAPHTLMTNSGNFTSAVEFDPEELFEKLQTINRKLLKADIIQEQTKKSYEATSIGIITGNGPDSGMFLWKQINDRINSKLKLRKLSAGDLSYPRIIVNSVPEMGLSMELDKRKEEVWKSLRQAVVTLCQSDIHYLMLACHTTQFFADDIRIICEEYDVKFYAMVDVIQEYILKNDIHDLTIFAIPPVANLGKYSAYSKLKAKNLDITPMKSVVEEEIQKLGYYIKKLSSYEKDSKAINKLGSLIRRGTNGENALIALTELSVLIGRFPKIAKSSVNLIDGLQLYAENMAEIYIASLPTIDSSRIENSWN